MNRILNRYGEMQMKGHNLRNVIFWLISIALLVFLTVPCTLVAISPEEQYIEKRDGFIREFAKQEFSLDDRDALLELEGRVRSMVGPVRVAGFSGPGRLNLVTLQDGIGFGQVDGLRFDNDRESLVVTTRSLLYRYLSGSPELPKTLSELAGIDDFYRRVFHADAGTTLYREIPVRKTAGATSVRAFRGVSSQEIGPLVPDEMFVFAATEHQVCVLSASIAGQAVDVSPCLDTWERFEKMSMDMVAAYWHSGQVDGEGVEAVYRYRDQGFKQYCRCIGREIERQPVFASLKKQAQAIVDRLVP